MMGKKKDAKKAAKQKAAGAAAGKVRVIPEAIGGVTLPKELRDAGEALIAKARSPEGRELIASGLAMAATAAAAAAAASAARHRPVPPAPPVPPVPPTPPAPARPGEAGTHAIDPRAVADAIGDATDAVLARLFGAPRSR